MEGYSESRTYPLHAIHISLSSPHLQVHRAELSVEAQLTGVKYWMYHWFITSFALGVAQLAFIFATCGLLCCLPPLSFAIYMIPLMPAKWVADSVHDDAGHSRNTMATTSRSVPSAMRAPSCAPAPASRVGWRPQPSLAAEPRTPRPTSSRKAPVHTGGTGDDCTHSPPPPSQPLSGTRVPARAGISPNGDSGVRMSVGLRGGSDVSSGGVRDDNWHSLSFTMTRAASPASSRPCSVSTTASSERRRQAVRGGRGGRHRGGRGEVFVTPRRVDRSPQPDQRYGEMQVVTGYTEDMSSARMTARAVTDVTSSVREDVMGTVRPMGRSARAEQQLRRRQGYGQRRGSSSSVSEVDSVVVDGEEEDEGLVHTPHTIFEALRQSARQQRQEQQQQRQARK